MSIDQKNSATTPARGRPRAGRRWLTIGQRVADALPRHKAANGVGPGRTRKSTRPGAGIVFELSPFEFLDRLADLVPPLSARFGYWLGDPRRHDWKKDAWELFDLIADPHERHNLLFDEAEASSRGVTNRLGALEAELTRLQREYQDDGLCADPATWPDVATARRTRKRKLLPAHAVSLDHAILEVSCERGF